MNETQSQVEFKDLQVIHAGQVAALHIQCISTSFISSMGIDFVTSLYEQFLDRELFLQALHNLQNEVESVHTNHCSLDANVPF